MSIHPHRHQRVLHHQRHMLLTLLGTDSSAQNVHWEQEDLYFVQSEIQIQSA